MNRVTGFGLSVRVLEKQVPIEAEQEGQPGKQLTVEKTTKMKEDSKPGSKVEAAFP